MVADMTFAMATWAAKTAGMERPEMIKHEMVSYLYACDGCEGRCTEESESSERSIMLDEDFLGEVAAYIADMSLFIELAFHLTYVEGPKRQKLIGWSFYGHSDRRWFGRMEEEQAEQYFGRKNAGRRQCVYRNSHTDQVRFPYLVYFFTRAAFRLGDTEILDKWLGYPHDSGSAHLIIYKYYQMCDILPIVINQEGVGGWEGIHFTLGVFHRFYQALRAYPDEAMLLWGDESHHDSRLFYRIYYSFGKLMPGTANANFFLPFDAEGSTEALRHEFDSYGSDGRKMAYAFLTNMTDIYLNNTTICPIRSPIRNHVLKGIGATIDYLARVNDGYWDVYYVKRALERANTRDMLDIIVERPDFRIRLDEFARFEMTPHIARTLRTNRNYLKVVKYITHFDVMTFHFGKEMARNVYYSMTGEQIAHHKDFSDLLLRWMREEIGSKKKWTA